MSLSTQSFILLYLLTIYVIIHKGHAFIRRYTSISNESPQANAESNNFKHDIPRIPDDEKAVDE
ncbi:uncharacterized protein N7469_003689 [Penicillium citrinum]|uniref:Uncharacterized protein n=2 Tax=Penicillium TaxID=5073 RepID=A0A9W9P399_PENCI|nr:uncharacterized protein N7469_003689 [Penicillium citrinum]KAJ5234521.1 hypothetical protein N7469_003689 [Penicillium citrinum]KAJ5590135.1 hypothetical protein N7450_004107 [Penicillium hetheringtonii]KAK5800980.1 hypothetical protein VI817_003192 [Penicillium citrinum]